VPAAAHLSVLGMPGLTAWAGVTQLLKISAGDVFLIDAALGPVGATAGQIAKRLGAKVIGIAGGADKCATLIDTLGFDVAIDRRAPDFLAQLKAAAGPDGISAHFENVGLSVLSPALTLLRLYGRVVLCGMVEHYHSDSPPQIPTGIIIGKRATIHGLVVYDFAPRQDEWITMATPWLQDGSLKMVLDASLGLASAPAQFERLMNGANHGKAMVTIAQDLA
jgi:NADPH-dependent curcumin reductase CurA